MSIVIPLKRKTLFIGSVSDPKIEVEIFTRSGFQPFEFILDSGSDCTMLPKYMANSIGIDLEKCPTSVSYGLTKEPIKVYAVPIHIKIAKFEMEIRSLITDRNDTPFLLGRMDIFDRFNVIFDNAAGEIILRPFTRERQRARASS